MPYKLYHFIQIVTREEGILFLVCKNRNIWANRPERPSGLPKFTQAARAEQGYIAQDPNHHHHHHCDRQIQGPAPVRNTSVYNKKLNQERFEQIRV